MVKMKMRNLAAIAAFLGAIAPAAAEQPESEVAVDRICYNHVQPGMTVADVSVSCETAVWPAEPRCRDPRLREHGEVQAWRAVLHVSRAELVVHLAFDAGCLESQS